jgi:hypothetical protein
LIRIAVEKHLGELKQRRIATTRAEPKKIDLGEPVAFWTRGEEEFADKVIQHHFDEDRWPQAGPGTQENPGSCAESMWENRNVFINYGETRGLRRGE